MGVLRDERRNQRIDLPNEKKKHHNSDGFSSFMLRTHAKYSPIAPDLVEIFEPERSRKNVQGQAHPQATAAAPTVDNLY
jgi:5,5'-dehydrodivanillate O-demethylase